ncbi:MAG: CPBP family intramembrane metalloprotease [Lachnospiraceae bacterium]|nr:CPBP family intramembrane metalloprotease [Lachnospiraceae bacterium]
MLTKTDKKNISRLFGGIILYIAVMNFVQLLVTEPGMLPESLTAFFYVGKEKTLGRIMLFSVLSGTAAALIYYRRMHKKYGLFEGECKEKRRITARVLLIGFSYTICCQLLAGILSQLTEAFFNSFGLSSEIDSTNFDVTGSLALAAYITVVGPFAEELIYRGFLMNGLKRYGKIYAIVVSTLIFGIMHGNFEQLPFAFLCGLMLGYAAMEYSLFCSFLMHVINNGGLSYALIFMQKFLPETLTALIIFIVLISSIIVMLQVSKKYRREAFDYIRRNETLKGAVPALFNIWVIIFIVWQCIELVFSITPLV